MKRIYFLCNYFSNNPYQNEMKYDFYKNGRTTLSINCIKFFNFFYQGLILLSVQEHYENTFIIDI